MRDIEVRHRLLVVRGLANVGHCAMVWGRYDARFALDDHHPSPAVNQRV